MKDQTTEPSTRKTTKSARWLTLSTAVPAAAFVLCGTLVARGDNPAPPQPPNSSSFGKTLAQWQALWVDWAVGDIALETDANGNALAGGVVLMSIPNAPGDGTPASLSLTLNAGQPFVLPLAFFYGNSYSDSTPDDVMVSVSDFADPHFKLTLDGATLVEGTAALRYYTQTVYDPPLPFDFPPFTTIIWVQGITMVHAPLPPGNHTITLDEKFAFPEYHVTAEYHNTWNIQVQPTH